jgi:hypothetical protein
MQVLLLLVSLLFAGATRSGPTGRRADIQDSCLRVTFGSWSPTNANSRRADTLHPRGSTATVRYVLLTSSQEKPYWQGGTNGGTATALPGDSLEISLGNSFEGFVYRLAPGDTVRLGTVRYRTDDVQAGVPWSTAPIAARGCSGVSRGGA